MIPPNASRPFSLISSRLFCHAASARGICRSIPALAISANCVLVTASSGKLYLLRVSPFSFSLFAASTASYSSGAVLIMFTGSRFVRNDVRIFAPFSYVIRFIVGIRQDVSAAARVNNVSAGANRKYFISCSLYHRRISAMIENGGLSTTTESELY